MPRAVSGIPELRTLGPGPVDLGHSSWLEITQQRVNTFAEATDDHQWIHTDPERAASGPFGGTIAHGYLTVALLIPLWTELLTVENVGMAVNCGLNSLRFRTPVHVGAKIRAAGTIVSVSEVRGGVEVVVDLEVEIDGKKRPACQAQAVYRFYE